MEALILRLPNQRRRSRIETAVRWVTLLTFTAGAVGIPLDPDVLLGASGTSCRARPGQACQCSEASRKLGTCCCAQGLRRQAGGCAVLLNKPAAPKSCCAVKKSASLPVAKAPASPTSRVIEVTNCPCSPGQSDWLLICGEPRVLPAQLAVPQVITLAEPWLWLDARTGGERPQPDVPPPKLVSLSV